MSIGSGEWNGGGEEFVMLSRVMRGGLIERVTFEQRPEGGGGVRLVDLLGKNLPGRGVSHC